MSRKRLIEKCVKCGRSRKVLNNLGIILIDAKDVIGGDDWNLWCKECYEEALAPYRKPKPLLWKILAKFGIHRKWDLTRYFTKRELKSFLLQALLGFVLWTAILTPYMIYGVKVNLEQYMNWAVMELVLVPPVAPFIVRITNHLVKKVLK